MRGWINNLGVHNETEIYIIDCRTTVSCIATMVAGIELVLSDVGSEVRSKTSFYDESYINIHQI